MPLNTLEKHLFTKEWIDSINYFNCNGIDSHNFDQLNTFLKSNALEYNRYHLSRTSIYVKNGVCVAYYSLAMNAIKVSVEGEYAFLKSYPALFVTRFAIDHHYHGKGIGKHILNDITRHAYENKEIAARFLYLDAYAESISWYLGNSFFKILYLDLSERIEKWCEKTIIAELNMRLNQGHSMECALNEDVNDIGKLKKNCAEIISSHVDDIFKNLKQKNPLLEKCKSKIQFTFEDNKPSIKIINLYTRKNAPIIRDWLKERDNILGMDITIPLYADINKYYNAIYG